MVVGSEVSLLLIHMTQYCCTNSNSAIFYLIWFLVVGLNLESENLPDKLVNLWIFTIGLTSSGCWPHMSSIWPWSGPPKVRLFNTFLGGLRHILMRTRSQCHANQKPTSGLHLMWHDLNFVQGAPECSLNCTSSLSQLFIMKRNFLSEKESRLE